MSKKILTVLVPVAAIVAFMAVPSLAQATQVQCGGVECANGATFRGQSSNLVGQAENIEGEDTGTIACTGNTFTGTLEEAQGGEKLSSSVASDVRTGCSASGFPADVTTNASAAAPWRLQIQQPSGGNVVAHLKPNAAAGSVIQLQLQIQFFGSIAHCDYSTSGLQLTGAAQGDILNVTGTRQFQKQAGPSLCGHYLTFSGSIQLEDVNGAAFVVHH